MFAGGGGRGVYGGVAVGVCGEGVGQVEGVGEGVGGEGGGVGGEGAEEEGEGGEGEGEGGGGEEGL